MGVSPDSSNSQDLHLCSPARLGFAGLKEVASLVRVSDRFTFGNTLCLIFPYFFPTNLFFTHHEDTGLTPLDLFNPQFLEQRTCLRTRLCECTLFARPLNSCLKRSTWITYIGQTRSFSTPCL